MIDTHCHINDEAFAKDPLDYIETSRAAGVTSFFVVGFDLESSKLAVKIAEKYECCYAAIGVHPSDWRKAPSDVIEQLEELAKSKKVIAIGEIGLDFYWDKDEEIKKGQEIGFIKQIELANKLDLPILIHCRDASEACLTVLKNHKVNKGGIMHCYAGSLESSKEYIKLGFLLGFGGVTTFKNAVKVKEVAASVPSTSYVLETDAPYLAPDPHRGQENHSKYLYLIRNKVAELRNITPEQVEKETNENVKRMFDL